MSTRQLRLSDRDQIKSRLKNFIGKKINIVMLDSTVMFGIVKEVSDTEVVLVNMRLKKARYAIPEIAEVYFDTPS